MDFSERFNDDTTRRASRSQNKLRLFIFPFSR